MRGQTATSRAVRTEEDALNADLTDSLHDPIRLVSPLAKACDTRDIKIDVRHPRIPTRDCIDKHRQCLISRWFVVSAPACQMRELDGNVGSCRQEFVQESSRRLHAIGPLF